MSQTVAPAGVVAAAAAGPAQRPPGGLRPNKASSSPSSSLPIHSFDHSVPNPCKRRHHTMASATATATMAAAGFDKRASTASSLQTPGSGTFPSEMLSPMAASPGALKRDELKTPITPPSAYLDFLNKMSPAVMTPAPTSNSMHFNFGGSKPFDRFPEPGSASISPPLTAPLPPLSRNTSYDSQASTTSTTSQQSVASNATNTSATQTTKPQSPRIIIPPSPFAKPAPRSARTPRLRIPQSPYTPALNSAQSVPSPYSATPISATPWSASFSPREDRAEGSSSGKVSVRQVVTRTVTYCRTPLDPAPKGKRRKIEVDVVEDLGSKSNSEDDLPSAMVKKEVDDDVTPSTAHPNTAVSGPSTLPLSPVAEAPA